MKCLVLKSFAYLNKEGEKVVVRKTDESGEQNTCDLTGADLKTFKKIKAVELIED